MSLVDVFLLFENEQRFCGTHGLAARESTAGHSALHLYWVSGVDYE